MSAQSRFPSKTFLETAHRSLPQKLARQTQGLRLSVILKTRFQPM